MRNSPILVCISRLLYPFMILFGCYLIILGDVSPGGGFQGGAVLATAYLITSFISDDLQMDLNRLIKMEKVLFIGILVLSVAGLFFSKSNMDTAIRIISDLDVSRLLLILLNAFIGIKVTVGLITVFSAFIEEGK